MRKLRHEEIPRRSPADVRTAARHPVCALLENIRSIHNVGSIFRTSDAALTEKLYLTGITGTPDHRGLHKAALGAQEFVPWSYEADPLPLVRSLKQAGYTLIALELTDAPRNADDIRIEHFPACLIVGNEIEGITPSLLACADLALEIPQYGAKQSLNVSVAYGIAMFDLVRRYRKFTR